MKLTKFSKTICLSALFLAVVCISEGMGMNSKDEMDMNLLERPNHQNEVPFGYYDLEPYKVKEQYEPNPPFWRKGLGFTITAAPLINSSYYGGLWTFNGTKANCHPEIFCLFTKFRSNCEDNFFEVGSNPWIGEKFCNGKDFFPLTKRMPSFTLAVNYRLTRPYGDNYFQCEVQCPRPSEEYHSK